MTYIDVASYAITQIARFLKVHAPSVEGKINRGKECWNDALKRSDHCLLLSTSV